LFVVAGVLVTVVTPARFVCRRLRRFAIVFRRTIVPMIRRLGRTVIRERVVWVTRVRRRIIPVTGVFPRPPERAETKSDTKSSIPGVAMVCAVIVGLPIISAVVMIRTVVVATEPAAVKMVNPSTVEGVELATLMEASGARAPMEGAPTTVKTATTMKSAVLC
jgi:hypothetical protein